MAYHAVLQYRTYGIFAAAVCMHPLPCGHLQNYPQSQTVMQTIVSPLSVCGAGGACCGVDA